MKNSLRSSILLASALLITLALSSCGSDGKTVAASTSFAYLQVNQAQAGSAGKASSSKKHSQGAKRVRATATKLQRLTTATTVDIASGQMDLYVMDSATGKTVQLNVAGSPVSGSAAFQNTQLSSDGTKLLVTAYDSNDYVQIYVADAKLATITQLTTDQSYHIDASFSADGKTIVYDNGDYTIYTIPSAGGTPTAINTSVEYPWYPVFTPDGTKIVFTACPDDLCRVYIMPVAGGTATALSTGTNWDGVASVSPDGTQVAFERDGDGEDIAVISINGETASNPAKILTSGLYSSKNSSEPMYVGSKVLFVSGAQGNNGSIFAINADGSGSTVNLTTTTSETFFNGSYWY